LVIIINNRDFTKFRLTRRNPSPINYRNSKDLENKFCAGGGRSTGKREEGGIEV